ncbi:MAG: 2-amino-4-hydroxy-6-hydroxymethyldihydropteridine diphosphokinase, partial [Dehalococcoidia bacterium]|nr:2-amino-4-hydroxy-6-hydroxymethyldihydropteridine diphosphokinase [Dehalococcoidia bacterium]
YETEPVGSPDQSPFLNLVCRASTSLSPDELHELTLGTEKLLGRVPTFRNGPRAIDIDILFYGSRCITSERLSIPHPRIPERAFVLIPLAEIAPDFLHPGLHKTVHELLAEVTDSHWVRPMNGGDHVPAVR